MKLMLVAGEASGDVHGSALIKELNSLVPNLETFGIGGKGMVEQGLRPYFMLDTMQSHGITELALHLPNLQKRFRSLSLRSVCARQILRDCQLLADFLPRILCSDRKLFC